jgi:hypothetical protein
MGVGCRVKQSATHQTTVTTTDSTSVTAKERLVEVLVPGDTVYFEQQIDCPEVDLATPVQGKTPTPFKANAKGKRSNGVIELDNLGRLRAMFNCAEWRDSVKVLDTELYRIKQLLQTDTTTITIKEKYIPTIYKYALWFSIIVLIFLVTYIGWKVFKPSFKFI